MRRPSSLLLLAALVAAADTGSNAREAVAQTPSCRISGTPLVPKGIEVLGAASGGDVIATFTGQPVALAVTPQTAGLAKLRLQGAFRLEGFVDAREIPAFTTRNLTVAESHIWLGGARRVKLGTTTTAGVEVEMQVGAPIHQSVKATVPCDGLSLDRGSFQQTRVPGDARGYIARRIPLEIRGEPGGSVLFTFQNPTAKDVLVLWSPETKDGQVRVLLRGDLVIDGWANASQLEAMKPGELMDGVAPGTSTTSAPKLVMQGSPTRMRASKETPIRDRAAEQATAIGVLESGAEVIVFETILGWSNVLPESLAFMPPATGRTGFWVKAAELTPR